MSEPEVIPAADRTAITTFVGELSAEAHALKITDAPTYERAAQMLKTVKSAGSRLSDKKKLLESPAKAMLKAVKDFFLEPEEQLSQAESVLKRAMIAYDEQQEELRRAEQRKLDEKAKKERERLEAQAKKAAEKGQEDKAEVLEQRAASVVAPTIQRAPPQVAGVSFRETWSAEVFDLLALVKAVAEGKQPLSGLEANMTFWNGMARAAKSELNVPGVRAVSTKGLAARKG